MFYLKNMQGKIEFQSDLLKEWNACINKFDTEFRVFIEEMSAWDEQYVME
jgi:hypothetical protein